MSATVSVTSSWLIRCYSNRLWMSKPTPPCQLSASLSTISSATSARLLCETSAPSWTWLEVPRSDRGPPIYWPRGLWLYRMSRRTGRSAWRSLRASDRGQGWCSAPVTVSKLWPRRPMLDLYEPRPRLVSSLWPFCTRRALWRNVNNHCNRQTDRQTDTQTDRRQ